MDKLAMRKKGAIKRIFTSNGFFALMAFILALLFLYSALFNTYSTAAINILLAISSLSLLLVLSNLVDKVNGYGKYVGHTTNDNKHMEEAINIDQVLNEKVVDDSSQNDNPKDDYVDFEPDFDIKQKPEEKPNDSEYQQLED